MLPGYPKSVLDILYPFNPYTAVNINGTVYLLKGYLVYKFITDTLRIDGYPRKINEIFPNIGYWIEVKFLLFNSSSNFKYLFG